MEKNEKKIRYSSETELRSQMVQLAKLMHQREYISSIDGNLSSRLSPNQLLTTPSGVNKGLMSKDDLVVVNMEGKTLRGKGQPSSELRMHLMIYKERPDVMAIVHAHPPVTVAFSLAGISLAQCLLPEVVFTLGSIPTVGYATPTTEKVPEVMKEPIRHYNALILERHGTVTVGKNLMQAYNRLETVEHTAKATFTARQMGQVAPLPAQEVNRLIEMGSRLGLTRLNQACTECGGCGRPPGDSKTGEKSLSSLVLNMID